MPTEDSKIKVNISVEDLQLTLFVANTDEEKMYRDAATQIQHRLQQLRTRYASLPSEKYYYVMAMLNTFVEAVRTANNTSNEPYAEMMKDLEKEIDSLEVSNNNQN